VAFFVADWTRRDARISAKLAEFGRAGVPMYLVVSPAAPDKPEVLPELLTTDSVVEAVRRAAGRVADAR
jgi:thiol:disulfide interchange protein DsbD